jgi:hypothetical protein
MLVTEPWFIAAIIVCAGGVIWLAVCVVVVWLSRRRKARANKCVIGGTNYSNHRGTHSYWHFKLARDLTWLVYNTYLLMSIVRNRSAA